VEYTNLYYILFGIAGLIFWTIDFYKLFSTAQIVVSKTKSKKISFPLRSLFFLVGAIGWLLIGYSLTGPKKPLGHEKSKIEINDVYIVVDVSRSMLAIDFPPNRLDVAKRKIKEFVDLRPTDRIAVIMFSEKAFTLLPLTTDLELVRQIIDDIHVGFLGSGTNIGDALGLAIGRASQSIAKNKVILLLTDGVSNVGVMTPEQAAEEAAKSKIRIYPVGIGSDKDARIPIGEPIFGQQRYQTIPGGSVDEKSLERIAKLTGGKHFMASNEYALKEVLEKINELEKTEIDSNTKIIYEELHYNYLFWGVILVLIGYLSRPLLFRETT
jgi:Ca-activated chloride channel family protein